jgi:hypothetical protein
MKHKHNLRSEKQGQARIELLTTGANHYAMPCPQYTTLLWTSVIQTNVVWERIIIIINVV